MKTILITGATGFLGSHLANTLIKEYKIIILKRSFSDIFRIKDILQSADYYDINNIPLKNIFKENKIDIVIHTATDYGRDQKSLINLINTNLVFPLELLELSIKNGIKSFINTDTFYYKHYNEYSLTKKQFVGWLKHYKQKIKIFNLQIEHMYGKLDNETKFLPQIIKKLIKNENINLTPGEQKRDLIYITDVVNAFSCIINNLTKTKNGFYDFSIGSGKTVSIRLLVEMLKKIINSSSNLNFGALPYRKDEIMESKGDISKILKFGWQPTIHLEKGLQKIVEYERKLLCLDKSN